MPSPKTKILIVDDDSDILAVLSRFLDAASLSVAVAKTGLEALRILKAQTFDLVLLDENLPNVIGHALIQPIREIQPTISIIIMTGDTSVQNAVDTILLGANDYLSKPLNLEDLLSHIERALNRPVRVTSNSEPHAAAAVSQTSLLNLPISATDPDYYEGLSPARRAIRDEVHRIASIPHLTALIIGDTGTGKEVIAKRIHSLSTPTHRPFVAVNCSTLSNEAWESEVFGVEQSPGSHVVRTKPGFLENAAEGSILFDGITSLSPLLQSRLLRLLDERAFHRVGGCVTVPLRARCIFTSSQPLLTLVQEGLFRQDFYYRISMFTIEMPALRQFKEDILPLTWHFLKRYNKQYGKYITQIEPFVQEALLNYDFPGNILELSHLIERSVIGATSDILPSEPILHAIHDNVTRRPKSAPIAAVPACDTPFLRLLPNEPHALQEIEIEAVKQALVNCKGNKSKAAKVLGISRRSLYRRLEKLGLDDNAAQA